VQSRGLTVPSGPLRRDAVLLRGPRQRPFSSSVSGAISLKQNRAFEILFTLVALASCLPARGSEFSVEPWPLQTGSDLVVHVSSTRYGDCWYGPLPFPSSQGVSGDVLQIQVWGSDSVECYAAPLDMQVPLGTIPAGITSVQLYGCGGDSPPGTPTCSSTPFLTFPVGEMIFRNSFE
jgi:hypothetical protein